MKFIFFILIMLQGASFKQNQLKQSRVKTAYEEKEKAVQQYFKAKKLNFDGFQLFIRAFKKDRELEVWIKEKDQTTYSLLRTYEFCTTSGTLGPKRREGDLQIPEGVYHINHFNPQSNFYLSLGINYPNASDKILSDKKHPGGAIYIHGSCVTIGCIPITDDKIKELYVLAVEATNNGQAKIPVHIFPAKLTEEGLLMLKTTSQVASNYPLWENLKGVYTDFEKTKKLKPVKVSRDGMYEF
jgi:murein L,D-transpeptidase YafK